MDWWITFDGQQAADYLPDLSDREGGAHGPAHLFPMYRGPAPAHGFASGAGAARRMAFPGAGRAAGMQLDMAARRGARPR